MGRVDYQLRIGSTMGTQTIDRDRSSLWEHDTTEVYVATIKRDYRCKVLVILI